MPSLFDTIQQNRQSLATAAPVVAPNSTERVQGLLKAKSGKAAGPGNTALSNLGEQSALDQTQQQLGALNQATGIQTQQEQVQQQGILQQEKQQLGTIDQARRFDTVENRIQLDRILSELEQNKGALNQERQQMALEQAGFLMAMQDKQYVDTLLDIGRRRNLDDATQFRIEMQNMTFGGNIDFLRQKLGQQDIMAVNDREFQRALSDMTLEEAIKIADLETAHAMTANDLRTGALSTAASQQARAANTQATYAGIGQGVSAGVEGYDKYGDKFEKKPDAKISGPVAKGETAS